ncbi:putative reverse transcriptase domain-containing protein [Tanacetum coccineum]
MKAPLFEGPNYRNNSLSDNGAKEAVLKMPNEIGTIDNIPEIIEGVKNRSMGFPTKFFSLMFAIPRMGGYLSHWRYSLDDPDTNIMRPTQNDEAMKSKQDYDVAAIDRKDRMQAARDRQKSYADKRRRPLEFEVGDKVMLKVAPWKGVMRFGKRGKLNPRYIGPFRIIERIGPVAYRLELPQELSRVHNVFHVCNLKKCLSDDTLVIPLEEIQLDNKLNFVEEPVEIMD